MRNERCENNMRFDNRFEDDCSGYKENQYEENNYEKQFLGYQKKGMKDDFCDCKDKEKEEKKKENKCCCKKSMEASLKLLCNEELAELIDFKKFAFLTDDFIVGSTLTLLKKESCLEDNLSDLNAVFERFSPCNCDMIDIEGAASYNIPLPGDAKELEGQIKMLIKKLLEVLGSQGCTTGMTVETLNEFLKISKPCDLGEKLLKVIIEFLMKLIVALPKVEEISLCAIKAVAFQVKKEKADSCKEYGDKKDGDNYQKAKCILQELLDKKCKEKDKNKKCGCDCHCDCDECCCTKGVLKEVANANFCGKITLTAGDLVLKEVTVLGTKGDTIVLANDKKKRFYFVCANAVELLK